jgi:hypothetical protein
MATRKILFRGQTRHKGEKTSISGKPLPGIWVTGGIFPQNKGYERAIIYTQDPKVEKHVVYAETVGQYTGVDDVLETPVFEDDIITFWQRTDTKHMQRYKGIVKYDEALTSFTVVSCEPNRLSDPVFLWDCSDIHVVGNTFDGELSKREQEVTYTYTKSLNSTIKELEKKIDTLEDWKPSIKYGTHYSDTSYRSLSAACERNGKNLFAVQSDAEVFIAARFGFNASKLVIIPDVETYESNRYGNVRLAKAEIRKPLYVSESFNYARFDVLCKGGHMQWELVDGKLCDYESPNI